MTPQPGDAPPLASSQSSPEQAIELFLSRLTTPCRLLVAFSGGGDSTGLLAALHAACRDRLDISLHSATVDHGLRSGSAQEAEAAAQGSAALGVPHAMLRWTGDKPASGIQAAAREARYRLLADEALRIGADFIVTGHNMDDQAETILMRRRRNPDRAEGMDEAVLVMRSAWVVRPLLTVPRAAIRDYLQARQLTWSEDPSNDNPAFERVRIRKALSSAMPSCPDGHTRDVDHAVTAQFIRDHVSVVDGTVAVVDLGRYLAGDPAHWQAVSTLAAVLGGRVHGPDSDSAASLIGKLTNGESFRATASRVVFDRRGSTLYLCREGRGLPRAVIRPGQTVVWDGRYEIVNDGPAPVVVGAGRALAACPTLSAGELDGRLPRGVAAVQAASVPRILDGDRSWIEVRTMLSPFDKFLPARKLELANAVANAFGLERFPSLSLSNGAF